MRGVVMFLVATVLALSGITGYQLKEAGETHAALCALRGQEAAVNAQTKAILRDSPAGLVNKRGEVVIEAALLRRGIEQRQATLDALRRAGLDCDE